MATNRTIRTLGALVVFGVALLTAQLAGQASAASGAPQAIHFADAVAVDDTDVEARMALEAFIRAMSSADAASVWTFAFEEDQEAFGTEDAVYSAFVET